MVAMETMHFFIVQLSLSLRTKLLCISGVPMNDLAPMKNCPGVGGGCKVGQISSRGIMMCSWVIKLKLRSFKSSEHINEKGDGPYCGFDY